MSIEAISVALTTVGAVLGFVALVYSWFTTRMVYRARIDFEKKLVELSLEMAASSRLRDIRNKLSHHQFSDDDRRYVYLIFEETIRRMNESEQRVANRMINQESLKGRERVVDHLLSMV